MNNQKFTMSKNHAFRKYYVNILGLYGYFLPDFPVFRGYFHTKNL